MVVDLEAIAKID